MNKAAQWDEEPSDPEISATTVVRAGELDGDGDEAGERAIVGERFGTYLIVGELAVGGMTEVCLAIERGAAGAQKAVVIKRLLPQQANDADLVGMFIEEGQLATRLQHPNIVRTYELGEVSGTYFTAMEYLPGEDLAKAFTSLAIARQKLPLHIGTGIVSRLCAGLRCAHELADPTGRPLALVHRDVDPANIILTYDGEVKLIDFGPPAPTRGKTAYMSPEQLHARGVDQRSDVFSAGVVLWELLTGRPLFMRNSEAATLNAIMNDPIPPPSRYRQDIAPELDAITLRALARTPADRYDSARELGAALDAFIATQPQQFDPKVLGKLVEELFGSTRADAKRSIAQARSLQRNLALVTKMRTEVRPDLAETLDAVAADPSPSPAPTPAIVEEDPPSKLPFVLGALGVAAIGVGVWLVTRGNTTPAPAPPPPPTQAVRSGAPETPPPPTPPTPPATATERDHALAVDPPLPLPPPLYATGIGTIVGKVAGASDAIVYVDGYSTLARGTATMKQEGKAFVPGTLVVQRGTTVAFPNRDTTFHNVFSVTPDNSFDLGSYRKGESKSVTMTKPGVVTVYCNMHPQMVGHILVVPNGNYVRADPDGTFRLTNVPAGTHKIVAWAPNAKPVGVQATVSDGQAVTVELAVTKATASPHLKRDEVTSKGSGR